MRLALFLLTLSLVMGNIYLYIIAGLLMTLNSYRMESLRLDIYLCKNKCEFNSSI
jgi:hypothetical protein